MKQDFRSYALVKALALVLTVACAVGAVFSGVYCAHHWNSLFEPVDSNLSGSYDPALWSRAFNDKYSLLMEVLDRYDQMRRGEALGYLEQKNYEQTLASLDPSATNFRYIVRDNDTGELLFSSSGERSLDNADSVWSHTRTFSPISVYYDYREYDEIGDITIFYGDDGAVLGRVPGWVNALYEDGETYRYAIEYGVDRALTVQDEFRDARTFFQNGDIRYLYLACGLTLAFLIGTVFLICCAGRRREAESFTLNWSDKIPYDLYLLAVLGTLSVCLGFGMEVAIQSYRYLYDQVSWILSNSVGALLLTGSVILIEAALMSTASRIKCHTLLRNTLCWRCCLWAWRLLCAAARSLGMLVGALPLTLRVMGSSALFLLINAFLAVGLFESYSPGVFLILLFLFNGFILLAVCQWTVQWAVLRQGARAILSGQPEARIDTKDMRLFPDLRSHAEALNDLGSAINTAVDERLRSERMKAELITNVSHDLKTPLTSIINYVDLLKKEDIQEEKAREYIEVLDRKSQRLKKLTEDLVEASKASTGTIAVEPERLGVVQLVDQALGEYSEKFSAAQLTLLPVFPAEEHYVMADGRHFWRVVDNLLGNCVKYAMPGTRVYLDVTVWDGWVTLSLKNISASQLNIPAEQLMERFVRGDESRTTEGSGLGLSIARSLTEVQGGAFRLSIDGDLFKASVSFPEVK